MRWSLEGWRTEWRWIKDAVDEAFGGLMSEQNLNVETLKKQAESSDPKEREEAKRTLEQMASAAGRAARQASGDTPATA